MVDNSDSGQIPQQELVAEVPCSEVEKTAKDFKNFWQDFRTAIEREDKAKLFSMTRRCSFDWSPFSEPYLNKPLEVSKRHTFQLDPALEIGRTFDLRKGTRLEVCNLQRVSRELRNHLLKKQSASFSER